MLDLDDLSSTYDEDSSFECDPEEIDYNDDEGAMLIKDLKKVTLVVDNYLFRKHRKNNNETIYWLCKNMNCSASVTTNSRLEILKQNSKHFDSCLQTSKDQLIFMRTVGRIKERSQLELTPIPEIYEEEITFLSALVPALSIALNVKSFNNMKSGLYAIRRKSLPALPISTEDIRLQDEYVKTQNGENFLLFDTKDSDRLISFCSNIGLEILSKSDQWHLDATFKSAPSIYYQVLSIHGYYQDSMFPCMFILMKNKRYELYKKLLELVKEEGLKRGILFNPQRFVCDFEAALMKAIKFHFPLSKLKGCMFHYSQSIWRHVSIIGLKNKYIKNENFRFWIKKLISLALVPFDDVSKGFEFLKTDTPNNCATDCSKIVSYFEKTWSSSGRFPPITWNHSETIGPRTNNHVEGYHYKINKSISGSHPNIYKAIKLFKKIVSNTSAKFKRIQISVIESVKREKYYEEKDATINLLLIQYREKLFQNDDLLQKLAPLMGDNY